MTSISEETLWVGRPSHLTNAQVYIACGLFFFLVLPLFYALWKWLELRCFEYELTTERLRISHGVLNKEFDELELYRIKDTSMTQPFFLRLFGLGNVVLVTSDKTTPELAIEAVGDPTQIREMIRGQVERLRDEKGIREVDFE